VFPQEEQAVTFEVVAPGLKAGLYFSNKLPDATKEISQPEPDSSKDCDKSASGYCSELSCQIRKVSLYIPSLAVCVALQNRPNCSFSLNVSKNDVSTRYKQVVANFLFV